MSPSTNFPAQSQPINQLPFDPNHGSPPLDSDPWSPLAPNCADVELGMLPTSHSVTHNTHPGAEPYLPDNWVHLHHSPAPRPQSRPRQPTEDSDLSKPRHSRIGSSELGHPDPLGYGSRVDLSPSAPAPELSEKKGYQVAGENFSNLTAWERQVLLRPGQAWRAWLARHRRLARCVKYAAGPSPPVVETALKPFLPKIERFFDRLFAPITARRQVIAPLFMLAWFFIFTFLVRASYFNSSTTEGSPNWVTADVSYWYTNADCGLNGTSCSPFTDYSYTFRCPGRSLSTELLNDRTVGAEEVIYQPLVVGGNDDLHTYRSDSWICAAAIHHGLFKNEKGGCGALELVGDFTNYVGGTKNGVKSTSFPSSFISSYRFTDSATASNCEDLQWNILGFNVAMLFLFSFVVRAAPAALFWAMFVMGFWHVVLVSDPTSSPPDVSLGFEYFLPAIFIGAAFWRYSFRWVVPAYEGAVLERTVWYCGGFWIGLLINISLAWIPIDRLTPHDIQQEPGGLVAVICVVIFVFLVVVNQLRVIRRTGWFGFYLFWYVVGGLVIMVLALLPGLEFRLHHYLIGMVLMPGLAFVTRPSAFFQGLLLGMFLDGAGRWGLDTILATPASLVGDGTMGTDLPSFLTSAANFSAGQTDIFWDAIPDSLASSYDGFSLLLNDVEVLSGSATNFSAAGWVNATAELPYYFRLAYMNDGTVGDFTRTATAFFFNGTWVDPASGAS